MKALIAGLSIGVLGLSCIVQAQTAAKALTVIGGISAENGEFSFIGSQVTAFSDKDIAYWQGADGKRDFVATVGGVFPVAVRTSGLVNIRANVSTAAAHEFPLCDSFDQISRWIDDDILDVLPKDAKIKSRTEFVDGSVLVAYSKPGTGHYILLLSLFESPAENHYKRFRPANDFGMVLSDSHPHLKPQKSIYVCHHCCPIKNPVNTVDL